MGKNETKNYVGGSGMDDMELDERDIQLMEESRKEGKKKLFIALGAIVLAVIVVVIYIVVRKNMTGKSESEDLIKTYMEGLEEADLDKVESVMDPDTIDSDSSKDLVTVFQTYKENNIEYTVSYTMGDGHVAESSDLAAVSSQQHCIWKDPEGSRYIKGLCHSGYRKDNDDIPGSDFTV